MIDRLQALTRLEAYLTVSGLYVWLTLLALEVPHQGMPGFIVTLGPLAMTILYLAGALREKYRAARG
jgi:hypothetical protein